MEINIDSPWNQTPVFHWVCELLRRLCGPQITHQMNVKTYESFGHKLLILLRKKKPKIFSFNSDYFDIQYSASRGD